MSAIPGLRGPIPGFVVDRDDPLKIGRVTVRVPGLFDGAGEQPSAWARPMATGASGADRGTWMIPAVDARVAVFCVYDEASGQYDPDELFYLPAGWYEGEVPAEADGDPQVRVVALDNYVVVVDERLPGGSLSVVHRGSGSVFTHDGGSLTLTVQATTGVVVNSTGVTEVRGGLVIIDGRPVLKGAGPIR